MALLVEGARRIGKSYIVEEFAKNEYESYILIDFNKAPQMVRDWFDLYLEDLDMLFLYLSQHYKVRLYERKSLIILDEVQLCPRARAAIKFLVKDGRYDYIETGSLVSIKKIHRVLCYHRKNALYRCIQWTLKSFFGLPVMTC